MPWKLEMVVAMNFTWYWSFVLFLATSTFSITHGYEIVSFLFASLKCRNERYQRCHIHAKNMQDINGDKPQAWKRKLHDTQYDV